MTAQVKRQEEQEEDGLMDLDLRAQEQRGPATERSWRSLVTLKGASCSYRVQVVRVTGPAYVECMLSLFAQVVS